MYGLHKNMIMYGLHKNMIMYGLHKNMIMVYIISTQVFGHLDTGFSWCPCVYKQNAEMVPNIPSCHYMLLM